MRRLSDADLERLRRLSDLPDIIADRYHVLEEIDRGGMGIVYRARDRVLERDVALKVLHPAQSSADAADRMEREARILASLEHPSIVPVHDVGMLPDGRVFYAMKQVRGLRLDRHARETLSQAERLRLFGRVCEAVAFAHARGVVHRDLKPENVMVGAFGEVLVMDWGVAKVLEEPGRAAPPQTDEASVPAAERGDASRPVTSPGMVLGTPGYMAPEQAVGRSDDADARADVYALGGILYFLLTGRAPDAKPIHESPVVVATDARTISGDEATRPGHRITPPRRFDPGVARPLEAICLTCLALDPDRRYPGADEVRAEVARYLDGVPVLAYRESVAERIGRWLRRYQVAVLLVLGYLIMRLVLMALSRT